MSIELSQAKEGQKPAGCSVYYLILAIALGLGAAGGGYDLSVRLPNARNQIVPRCSGVDFSHGQLTGQTEELLVPPLIMRDCYALTAQAIQDAGLDPKGLRTNADLLLSISGFFGSVILGFPRLRRLILPR